MQQPTLASSGFERYRKITRRSEFLAMMAKVVPWPARCALIEPHYPKASGAGRPAIGLERMLRIHFLQQWFNLSDPGVEEALYESLSMRGFAGIDLGREPVPDETTICKFRHLLERERLGEAIFVAVNQYLQASGPKVATGTIVDATLISAPSSTKNQDRQRDREMKQTRKGNQWYFGMKAHIGTDSRTRLIHSLAVTPANVHDSQALAQLLQGRETRIWGDSAYVGQREVMRAVAPRAKDFTQHRRYRNRPLSEKQIEQNRTKSSVRAKVEHAFHVIKRIFGFEKVRYRGLAKDGNRLQVLCALANVYLARRWLWQQQGSCA